MVVRRDVTEMILQDPSPPFDLTAFSSYTLPVPTTVFTSEDYGAEYCKYLRCEHMLVDKHRVAVPTSGSAVRTSSVQQWSHISKPLRGYYACRFVLVGAESTGKSTLIGKLVQHYHTTSVSRHSSSYIC